MILTSARWQLQLLTQIEGEGTGDVEVQIPRLRSMVSSNWTNHFRDFDLDIPSETTSTFVQKVDVSCSSTGVNDDSTDCFRVYASGH